jgi:Predicted integral membrane protein
VYAFLAGFGILLCKLPGLLVIFFFQLGPYYVLDRGMGVREALVASAQVIRRNLAAAFLMTVLNALVLVLGGLFFGILTLLTLPFATLFTAYLYRTFNGEPVLG